MDPEPINVYESMNRCLGKLSPAEQSVHLWNVIYHLLEYLNTHELREVNLWWYRYVEDEVKR